MTNQSSNRTNDALIPAIILFGSLTLLLLAILPQPTAKVPAANSTSLPTTVAVEPTNPPPVAVAYDPAAVNHGQGVYQAVCSTCHGLDAQGIPGLGKNLITSEFVHGISDDELLQFIIVGRDSSDPLNTTGIPMPARGGNPSLTDQDLLDIIAYLRTQSDPSLLSGASASTSDIAPTTVPTVVPTSAPAVVEPTSAPVEAVLPTAIPVTVQAFSASAAYAAACSSCHGIDGTGNLPIGPGILDSEIMADSARLQSFLTEGNITATIGSGYSHQPRGGYPPLTDEQISALTEYLLTLVKP